jgi:cephalosporin hydroxylase
MSEWRVALEQEYRSRLADWSDIQGHLEFLHEQVTSRPGARVLELGVRWATSTAALLDAVDLADGHLWSVDLSPPRSLDWWSRTGRWTFTLGDDMDQAVVEAQPDEVDLLLLDTSHAYDHTLAELRTYVPKMKSGGLVCCHDTDVEAPELVGPQPPFPVTLALNEFCAETGLTWENRTGSCGMGVLLIP